MAGNGTAGYSGDGGDATSASLNFPWGVALDGSGNLYIADRVNHRVRKVSPSGTISTVVGNGSAGYSGDGGAATSASLNSPYGLAFDGSGNLYIADRLNQVIRKVSPSGTISTVAGNGTAGYSGDGGDATSASLNNPWGVAVDGSGNLYIADLTNNVIRKVSPSGTISTVAGNGTTGYSGDDGPATSASVNQPWGLAVDGSGNLYIGDAVNNRIRKVASGMLVSAIAGSGNVCVGSSDTLSDSTTGGVWSCSNNSIAIVDSNGVVTGVAEGNAIISYTVSGSECGASYNTIAIAVHALPNAGVITGPAIVAAGNDITLSESISGGEWISLDTTVAIVSSAGLVHGIGQGYAAIIYGVTNSWCSQYVSDTIHVYDSITISGPDHICQGSVTNFSTNGIGGTWSSSDNSVIAVDVFGNVTGVSYGHTSVPYASATLTYTINSGGVTLVGTKTVYVDVPIEYVNLYDYLNGDICAGSTVSVAPTFYDWAAGVWGDLGCYSSYGGGWVDVCGNLTIPAGYDGLVYGYRSFSNACGGGSNGYSYNSHYDNVSISGGDTVCIGGITALTGNYSDGWFSHGWNTSDTTIAKVNSSGAVIGVNSGIATISFNSYGCGGQTATTAVTVNNCLFAGDSITISGPDHICQGSMTNFSTNGIGGTWSSSDNSVIAVDVFGNVTGVSYGHTSVPYASATLTYTINSGGVTLVGTKTVYVDVPIEYVNLYDYLNGDICAGSTVSVAPTFYDWAAGVWGDLGCYSSYGGGWVDVCGNLTIPAGYDGLVYGYRSFSNACGGGSNGYSYNSHYDNVSISGGDTVCIGGITALTGNYSDGWFSHGWNTSDSFVAIIDDYGHVLGMNGGTATISFSSNGCGGQTAQQTIIVNDCSVPLSELAIYGPDTICQGTFVHLGTTAGGGTWISGDSLAARIDSVSGRVEGMRAGHATITYSVSGYTAFKTLTIMSHPYAGSIAGISSVCVGSAAALTDSVVGGSWSSSDASAVVDASGVVTGLSAGSAIISYSVTNSCGTSVDTQAITIEWAPNAGTITGSSSLTVGATVTLTDTTTGGTWSASNGNATVDASGVVSGVAAGIDTISYTVTNACGSATATYEVTITGSGVISGPTNVCRGSTANYTYSGTPGGTWRSSDTTVALIDNASGLLTGVASGSSTISYSLGGSLVTYGITVDQPNAGTIPVSGPICVAGGYTFSSTGDAGGKWSILNFSGDIYQASIDSMTGFFTCTSNGNMTGYNGSISGIFPYEPTGVYGADGVSFAATTVDLSYAIESACGIFSTTRTVTVSSEPPVIGGLLVNSAASQYVIYDIMAPTSPSNVVCASQMPTTTVWGYSFDWATITGGSFNATPAGTYTVTVGNACSEWSQSYSFTQSNPSTTVALGPAAEICQGTPLTVSFSTNTYGLDAGSSSVEGPWWLADCCLSLSSSDAGTLSFNADAVGMTNLYLSFTDNICYTPMSFEFGITIDPGNIDSINGSSMLCQGGGTVFANSTFTGSSPYTWSSSDLAVATIDASTGALTGIEAGTTSISYALTNSCGTLLATKQITVSSTPNAGSITGSSTFTVGATSTLTDTTTGGVWFASNTNATVGTSGVVTGVTAGIDTISYTVANACGSATATYVVTITTPNDTPSFVNGAAYTIPVNVCQNSNGVDLTQYLHVADTAPSQTLTVSLASLPDRCGSVVVTGGTAASGNADITPSGSIVYTPSIGFTGTEHFEMTVFDGTSSSNIVVAVNVSAVTASVTSQTNVSCNGGNNGTATIEVFGPVGTLTYDWAPGTPTGDGSATVTGLTAGVYTLTASDGTGCEVTQEVTITEPTILTASIGATTNITCNGLGNGTATVDVAGGTGAFTYSWSPAGGTLATATGLTAGDYTVTVTDANSCTQTASTTIIEPTALTASITATTNVSCNAGSNGTATVVAAGGTATYTYSWSPAGGTLATATGLTAGDYTVTVTDANSCTQTASTSITEPTALTASITATTNVSCNGLNNGNATVTAAGGTGTFTYSWSPAGGTLATATGLSAGDYTVTVTDANSCTQTASTTITEPTVLTASITATTNVSCNGGSNGAITVTAGGGTAPYSYSWSPAGGTLATATGLTAGNYTVTVTDANNCTQATSTAVTEPTVLTASVTATTDVSCNGGSNGTAKVTTAGGTTPYTYSWSPAGGALATGTGLTAGNYTVTITDANSCTQTAFATIAEPTVLTASITATTDVSCFGGNNGAATVTAGGGTAPYTYSWSSLTATTDTVSGLTANIYTATVTDAHGCIQTAVATITQPATYPSIATIANNGPICSGTTLSLTSLAAGGVAPYTFSWSGPAGFTSTDANPSVSSAPVTASGVYSLTVTDAHACVIADTMSVLVKDLPVIVSSGSNSPVCAGVTLSLNVTATATGAIDYSWTGSDGFTSTEQNPGVNTTTMSGVYTYTVMATGNGGCNSQAVFTATVNPLPHAVAPADMAICNGASTTLISFGSDVPGTTFDWANTNTSIGLAATGTGDIAAFTAVNAGTDPVVATIVVTPTANGCVGTNDTMLITVNPTPQLTSTLAPAAICDSTTFTYTPTSLTAGTTYVWSRDVVTGISNAANADNTDPAEVLDNTTPNPVAVTYVYTLTANGCTNTQSVVVTVNPTPMLTSTLTAAPVCNSTLFSYTPTSATAGTTFSWTRDTMANILNATAAGTNDPMETLVNVAPYPVNVAYVYTLTANGCSHTETVQMTVNPTPQLSSTLVPASICDSALFSYVPTSLTSGTTFSWSRATVTGIHNPAGAGTDNPMETLYNTTADSIAVDYIYTLTAYGCSNTQAVRVYVKPTPKLSSTLTPAAICNNTVFNYTPASATGGTSFTWSRALAVGISNPANAGSGNPMEVLNNNTANQVSTRYVFTLNAAGCIHSQVVTAKVNATPALSGTTVGTICSGAPFFYMPGSATVGTSFTWSRATAPGISNTAATGVDSIAETLYNLTNATKYVTYRYTLVANGCSNIQNVVIGVNPTPVTAHIATHPDATLCSQTMYQNFGADVPAPDSAYYTWTAINAEVYAQGAGHTNALVSFPNSGPAAVVLIAGVDGYICNAYDTFLVNVSTSVAPNADVFYVHDHFFYTDNTVSTYQWGYDDATSLDSLILTGQVDQNYFDASPDFTNKKYWVMTTKDGCMSKSYYNAPAGVVNVNNTVVVNLTVAPNPASNSVVVTATGIANGNDKVELADMTGKVVLTAATLNNKALLNVADLASGVYVVTYYHNGIKAGSSKLVKE